MSDNETVLLVDEVNGVNIPKIFCERAAHYADSWQMSRGDMEICMGGPEEEFYWEAWESIINQAKMTDSQGREWRLWQDGSLFAYTGDGEQWQ